MSYLVWNPKAGESEATALHVVGVDTVPEAAIHYAQRMYERGYGAHPCVLSVKCFGRECVVEIGVESRPSFVVESWRES